MIQKKNLLFLDIDGVLNCNRTYHASMHLLPPHPLNDESLCRREVTTLDPIAVNMLKRLCMDSHVEIVISSTWRFNYTIEQFKDIFAYYGWENAPVISMTPSSAKGFRGEEVRRWLEDNLTAIELNRYVIIDDDSDFYIDQPYVKVNSLHGFSYTTYKMCECLLDRITPSQLWGAIGWYLPQSKKSEFQGTLLPAKTRHYINNKVRKSL